MSTAGDRPWAVCGQRRALIVGAFALAGLFVHYREFIEKFLPLQGAEK